ncbi:MAG TPA: nitroreductase family deazaflavin-dependent oxidoreductase [Blastocatellia bacterium]|nr:nitroreductase family deazaflavin-dependent oxidoreductase [Blastocatellia bacterium]
MSKSLVDKDPSRGLLRFLFRLPILLYHLGLGWLFGNRFLLLKHTGRKFGLLRETVLEVIRYDRNARVYMVASGWGEKSMWYQNILHNPRVEIESGDGKMKAIAERVSEERAEEELRDYARRHPFAYRHIKKWVLGEEVNEKTEEYKRLARRIPIIEIREEKNDGRN